MTTAGPQRRAPHQAAEIEPMFFGPAGSLFGIYHPPGRSPQRPVAIVLCYPAGHEALRMHRSFRNLATWLARTGFPVLRFDYSGSGDSAGEGTDATLEAWQDDLQAAIDEVRRRSGATRVAIAGQRLGASLAWNVAHLRSDVELLVLWDPVVNGRQYLEQLRAVERAWRDRADRRGAGEPAPDHLLGSPLSAGMQRQIEALDLVASPCPRAQVFAIMASDAAEEAAWRDRIAATYGHKRCAVAPTVDWLEPESIHTAAYPQAMLQLINRIFEQAAV